MSEAEYVLLSELLGWYRLQRHDFLNHWQVIAGNLQLQQAEKALAYMKEAMVIQEQEQKIGFFREPALTAILLGLMIGFRQIDVKATLSFPDQMKKEDYWQAHWREEYIEPFYGYTKACLHTLKQSKFSGATAEVYLYEEPRGLSCQAIIETEDTVIFERLITLTPESSQNKI